jgi:dihydroorotate dehydrogenase
MGQLNIDHKRAPIFIGAGVAKDERSIRRTAESGAAAAIYGSFTDPAWAGNDADGTRRVEYWDEANQAYYNSIGLKNPGRIEASRYLPRSLRAAKDMGLVALISLSTLKGEDPTRVLPPLTEWALDMGADGVEINGSCPNQDPRHPLLCLDVDATYDVIEAIREQVGTDPYLMYKVSALPPEVISRYRKEGRLAVNAIDTINTIGNQPSPIDPATGQPSIEVNDGLAGKSGPSIKPVARANLHMWLGEDEPPAEQPFDIWSIGGVDSGHEVHYRRKLGELAGAFTLVGGVQAFRRADNLANVIRKWQGEYAAAHKT